MVITESGCNLAIVVGVFLLVYILIFNFYKNYMLMEENNNKIGKVAIAGIGSSINQVSSPIIVATLYG